MPRNLFTFRERILEEAIAGHPIIVKVPLEAMRILAKFDTFRARTVELEALFLQGDPDYANLCHGCLL